MEDVLVLHRNIIPSTIVPAHRYGFASSGKQNELNDTPSICKLLCCYKYT